MPSLVYVYAVLEQPLEAEINGIDLQPVRWIVQADLAAAVSDVPAEDFDEEPLNANVSDMAWLGPRAIAHQDVNQRLFELAGTTLPLSFGTVFRDDQRVRQMLREDSAALSAQLRRVHGCGEWVLSLHLLREPSADDIAAESPAIQAMRSQIAASAPGRAHLLSRQLATLERDEARRLQNQAADVVLNELNQIARDVYREPLPSETVERPLLRASLLVARQQETEFIEAVERLRQRWPEPTYRLLLTGPWPTYRFGGLPS